MFQNFQILRNLTMQVYCNPQLNLRIYNSDGHALGWLMLAFYLFLCWRHNLFSEQHLICEIQEREREKKTY